MFVSFFIRWENGMDFYTIDGTFVEYLSSYDNRVPKEHGDHARPYVGIIFAIHGLTYFAPLSHPKPKYQKMNDSLDFLRIASGELGAINLNNMIPSVEGKLSKIDISNYPSLPIDEQEYRHLLRNQNLWVNRNSARIISNAKKLHSLYCKGKLRGKLKDRCCNFPVLEKACIEYEYPLDDLQQLPKAIEPDRLYLAAKPVLNNYQLINSFDFSNDGYEEGIFQGMSLHRDFAIFGINADQNAFAYKREMFESTDAPTFEEAIMSSPVTDLRQLEIFIGQQFEVMEKSPFLFR